MSSRLTLKLLGELGDLHPRPCPAAQRCSLVCDDWPRSTLDLKVSQWARDKGYVKILLHFNTRRLKPCNPACALLPGGCQLRHGRVSVQLHVLTLHGHGLQEVVHHPVLPKTGAHTGVACIFWRLKVYSNTQRVQVRNIEGLWCQIPLRVLFLEPEASNIESLDPLGHLPCASPKAVKPPFA